MKTFLLSLGLIFFSVSSHSAEYWIGKQKMLVLLLEWDNYPSVLTEQEISESVFGNGLSLKRYFYENSKGSFEISGATTPWLKTGKKWNQPECSPNFVADYALEALKKFDLKKYDSDGDGRIDHLVVVHSVSDNAIRMTANCFYSSRLNRVANANYISTITSSGGKHLPLGLIIHEAGHYLYNFRDHYGDHYNGRYGIGMWGAMGLGCWGTNNLISRDDMFRVPSHFMPIHKERIGWQKPEVIKESSSSLVITPIEKGGKTYKIPVSGGAYYLEYRSKNSFSVNHPGHGLLIWKNYTLMQADGRDDLNKGNRVGYRPLPPIQENFGDRTDPFGSDSKIYKFEDTRNKIRVLVLAHDESKIMFQVQMGKDF